MNDKMTGSFYTPTLLVDFMYAYLKKRATYSVVLEPSAGDGAFLSPKEVHNVLFHAIEVENAKVMTLQNNFKNNATFFCSDFLDYKSETKYDLVIGNPPYINKKRLSVDQIEKGLSLAKKYDLPASTMKNIWVSFILKSLELIKDDGSIFFVLPYEFLQVDYATELRNYLENVFSYIEITVFDDKVFESVEQDVCLVFLSNDTSKLGRRSPYISLSAYKTLSLSCRAYHTGYIERNKPIKKWSNSILNDTELEFLNMQIEKFQTGSQLFDSCPGIVTAANDFFVLNKEQGLKFNTDELVHPIITKSQQIGNKTIFTEEDYKELVQNNKKVKLLYLTETKYKYFPSAVKAYLKKGKEKKIAERYKCKKRDRWYDLRLGVKGNALFFKRYHILPRFVINEANVYTTDIAYNIVENGVFDAGSLVFCFYNSLTLTMCEFNGRFYGGGVCELTPKEFKALPIPIKHITEAQMKILDSKFRNNCAVDDIINYVDSIVLDGMICKADITRLKLIRKKLMQRRLKNL